MGASAETKRNVVVPIGPIEGEDLMNRFRKVINDPVLSRMDYRTGCIKASEIIEARGIVDAEEMESVIKCCRDNCEHLNLLVDLREKYEKRYPEAAAAGRDGPDVNQFLQEDDFCKSCPISRQDELHLTWFERWNGSRSEKRETKLQAKIANVHGQAKERIAEGKTMTRKQLRVLRKADLIGYTSENEEEVPDPAAAAPAEARAPKPEPVLEASAPIPEPVTIAANVNENAPAPSPVPETVSVLPKAQDLAQRLRYGSGKTRFAAETKQAIEFSRPAPIVAAAADEQPSEPVDGGA